MNDQQRTWYGHGHGEALSWATVKTVAGHSVYGVEPSRIKVTGNTVTFEGRSWVSPNAGLNGTFVEVFCPVGSLSRKNPSFAIVRKPDGSVQSWPASDNKTER